MATAIRFDAGQFDVPEVLPLRTQPHPRQRYLAGMEDARRFAGGARLTAEITPLDERLQPCGVAFAGDVEWRAADTMTVWHARPARSPYLAVDVPCEGGNRQRIILRVTQCESFGLDYAIRGDVMGS
ncbi:MAG TPA: hypothetical protein VHC22_20545 [Pirellulales bacterium]|nr:hypothetical protein [Pirellulales bacterium]